MDKDKIWKFTICQSKPHKYNKFFGVVIADTEKEARELIKKSLRDDVGITSISVKKATTYPLVVTGGMTSYRQWPGTLKGESEL